MTKAYWIGHATVDDPETMPNIARQTLSLLPNTMANF
jgi:hypothetical protein